MDRGITFSFFFCFFVFIIIDGEWAQASGGGSDAIEMLSPWKCFASPLFLLFAKKRIAIETYSVPRDVSEKLFNGL